MSGNWEKAFYPADGRVKGKRMAGRTGKVEEGYGAKLRDFTTIGIGGAAGGVMRPRFAVLCALSGLSGSEELAGIPGTVGGAMSMNAGAYGRFIGEIAEWVEIVDAEGRLHRLVAHNIGVAYRPAARPRRGGIARGGV